jgi:hypothetical protein
MGSSTIARSQFTGTLYVRSAPVIPVVNSTWSKVIKIHNQTSGGVLAAYIKPMLYVNDMTRCTFQPTPKKGNGVMPVSKKQLPKK